jgi:hypothetical protein
MSEEDVVALFLITLPIPGVIVEQPFGGDKPATLVEVLRGWVLQKVSGKMREKQSRFTKRNLC